MYRQELPFAIQVELVEGCNLYCDFCGLQGIREKTDKTYKMMPVGTAIAIARQIKTAGWHPRVEFAMHGEPTMHSDAPLLVKAFRKRLPKVQLMMTSNGGGLLPNVVEKLTELFDAGLNVFAFDAYEYVKIKDKVDAALDGDTLSGVEVHRYPDDPKWSPHNRYGPNARVFIRVKDISIAEKGTHSTLNNHCGAGSEPLKKPMQVRCAKPFREMSIRWDGSVAICCNDWRGVFKCGNVNEEGLVDIWNGPELSSARRFLIRGDRASVKPCDVCDAVSYRIGLLPDKFGQRKLRTPNDEDRQIVKAASGGDTYTQAVIRPWEIAKAK